MGNVHKPSLCCAGVSAHTQYFFNDLQRVGKEHVLRPVGGASVPSTCRWEGSELRHQSESLQNAATPEGLQLNSHHACNRRWGKDRLTLCPRLPEDTGALNTRWVVITVMQRAVTATVTNIRFTTYHTWRTLAGVSWCQGSRGPQRFECQPLLNSSPCRDICVTPFSKPKATNTLK